jgi:hypothetical protein
MSLQPIHRPDIAPRKSAGTNWWSEAAAAELDMKAAWASGDKALAGALFCERDVYLTRAMEGAGHD